MKKLIILMVLMFFSTLCYAQRVEWIEEVDIIKASNDTAIIYYSYDKDKIEQWVAFNTVMERVFYERLNDNAKEEFLKNWEYVHEIRRIYK